MGGTAGSKRYFGLYPRVRLVKLSEPLNLSRVSSLPGLARPPSPPECSAGLAGGELKVIKAAPNLCDT